MDSTTVGLIVVGAIVALYVFKQYQDTQRMRATQGTWQGLINLGGNLAGML